MQLRASVYLATIARRKSYASSLSPGRGLLCGFSELVWHDPITRDALSEARNRERAGLGFDVTAEYHFR